MEKVLKVLSAMLADRSSHGKIENITASHIEGSLGGYDALMATVVSTCDENPETPDGQLAQSIVDAL